MAQAMTTDQRITSAADERTGEDEMAVAFVHPPIPSRAFDFQATLRTFDPEATSGRKSVAGHGETAQAAMDDLRELLADEDA